MDETHGKVDPEIVCPQCQTQGHVHVSWTNRALKEAHCGNCNLDWQITHRRDWVHWFFVALYWLLLLDLLGLATTENEVRGHNPRFLWYFWAVVAFGIWRVVRKWRRNRVHRP
jgi:hypothetical protein